MPSPSQILTQREGGRGGEGGRERERIERGGREREREREAMQLGTRSVRCPIKLLFAVFEAFSALVRVRIRVQHSAETC